MKFKEYLNEEKLDVTHYKSLIDYLIKIKQAKVLYPLSRDDHSDRDKLFRSFESTLEKLTGKKSGKLMTAHIIHLATQDIVKLTDWDYKRATEQLMARGVVMDAKKSKQISKQYMKVADK